MRGLTQERAVQILRERRQAHDFLVDYARMIDIPSVPLDGVEDEWELVETPLAEHHTLVLWALQAMVDGTLLYDPAEPAPDADGKVDPLRVAVTQPTPAGLLLLPPKPPVGGRRGGTPPSFEAADPSPAPPKPHVPANTLEKHPIDSERKDVLVTPESIKIRGDIPEVCLRDRSYRVCKRVMIMMPPGSAKSTYASVVFPTWAMGREPDQEIILTGWGDPICQRHGKRARTICHSPLYRAIMSSWLDPNTKAADDWALTNRSNYKSSGIRSGVAGFRCDGLIWDDLTKNRKEADSETIRNDTYNAYIDDARSRKKPNAWEVGIGTRWHEDEIMGRILPEGYNGESGYMLCRDGNVWLIICLAAECEREDDPLGREIGEMIWPEWFGEGYWAEKRINARSWGSLYQQRPAPEEGVEFKKDWIRRYSVLPEGDNYISFDPAVTSEEQEANADDTCIAVWRVDEYARIYLMEEWVQKATMDVWIEQLIRTGKRFKPLEMVSEVGVIRRASEPFIKRAMLTLKAFFKFEWVHRHADKPAMARAAQGMMASGQIYLPEGPVGDAWENELLKFPTSKDDHRVDSLVNLTLRLEAIWEAHPEKVKTEESGIISGMGSFGGEDIKVSKFMPPRFPKRTSRWKRTHRMPRLTR